MPTFTGKEGDFIFIAEWHFADTCLRWHATVRSLSGDIRGWPNGELPDTSKGDDPEAAVRIAVNSSIERMEQR
jgi:hypothetical protein